jgi:poly(A) polymerase
MTRPAVVPRDKHTLSRSQIDPDALTVLNRLHQHEYVSYLVGGSVRDLLIGRHPKDFDIGTSARPNQMKRLFRNCWVIGRRFRLVHVRFGTKTIEVATFRRQLTAEERTGTAPPPPDANRQRQRAPTLRDNAFGTPEEDAFRRDFTVNALFYDIGTRSIIDYTGGLEDLEAGLIRSIGDPEERFEEDPVRMWRAVAMAARLGFRIDPPIDTAIRHQRAAIATSAPARLIEECYKLLRTGASEKALRMMADRKLLGQLARELQRGNADPLWRSLAALDVYRQQFNDTPATLSNAILLGSLLVPLRHSVLTHRPKSGADEKRPRGPILTLGLLPLARRDVERLRQVLSLQRRLRDPNLSTRSRQALTHRVAFPDALTWLEIHGNTPELVKTWRAIAQTTTLPKIGTSAKPTRKRRRRRPSRRTTSS